MSDEARARRWFDSLSRAERFELGDALVLGFDWRDWFDEPQSAAFMRALDDARMLWEMSQ